MLSLICWANTQSIPVDFTAAMFNWLWNAYGFAVREESIELRALSQCRKTGNENVLMHLLKKIYMNTQACIWW